MRFWDASAVVPLCCRQPASAKVEALLREDRELVVWWAMPVECSSALARLDRAKTEYGFLDEALAILAVLQHAWHEVLATESVREHAILLLRRHDLRATAALQRAAALTWASDIPPGAGFVSLDERLNHAARGEGLTVLP